MNENKEFNHDPACSSAAVTPHNTNEIKIGGSYMYALWVGGAGAVKGKLVGDSAESTFAAVPAGTLLPFRFKTVHTDSTATLMIAVR